MPSSILNSDDGVISGTSGLKTTGGDDGVLNIQNNGTTAVTVNASGNVGIGTTSPSVGGAYSANNTLTIFGGTNSGAEDTAYLEIGSSTNTNDYQTGAIAFYNNDNSGAGSTTRKQTAIIRTLCATSDSNADDDSGGNLTFITKAEAGTLAEQMRLTSAGNLQFNSGYGSVATAYGCRAWVNFDGTGTVAIREDGNVSSITDDGTGSYQVNFSTALADSNYAVAAFAKSDSGGGLRCVVGRGADYSTTALDIEVRNAANNNEDVQVVCVSIFR